MLAKKTVVFKTVDSIQLQADVYLPCDHSPEIHYPAILYLHGGGMVVGDRGMLPEMEARGFIEQGWIVISSDYRLVPETKYPEAFQDVLDAYEWMRTQGKTQFGINDSKIAIVGSSAGARLALLAGYMTKELPCCLISLYGQTDFRLNNQSWLRLRSTKVPTEMAFSAVYKHGIRTSTAPDSPIYPAFEAYLAWAIQNDELLKAYFGESSTNILEWYSPCLNVHRSFPPTLLVHGKEDMLTPLIHAEVMYQALKEQNIKTDMLAIDG
jgi:acetyl esterase/lipase